MQFSQILSFLKTECEKPLRFGSFHIISIVTVFAVTVIFCKAFKKPTEKTARRLLFLISIIIILFEIYKQLVYSLEIIGDRVVFSYNWHIFPWQFCSTPMFAGLAAAVIKNKKVHTALCSYLASYSLVAGLFITIGGGNTFSGLVGINIQTMTVHGLMVVTGFWLLFSGYVKPTKENFKNAVGVFMLGAAIAAALNQAAYIIGIPDGEVFNMYFISPYFKDDVPLLAPLRELLVDPIYQILYLAVFTAISAAIFFLPKRMNDE